jgi:hypothetical protein
MMWGVLAFVLNYIPNIGSVIAAIPPVIQALLFNSFGDAVMVASGYIAINMVFGNILEPRVMGRWFGVIDASGISIIDILGVAAGSDRHVAFSTANYCGENSSGTDSGWLSVCRFTGGRY